ncbi:hypothetical protein MYP_3681 [Sporocytophaga myxococcoides]|uniref:Uncharacterized protein n=1 Tax=Sporocytophaga myxococcoides TaxID=153721 RepID=A0A098LJ89_9BACT|nr:hypothetical protein MYP_3681 [Sporocytophaga myxococcoides]
MSGCRSNWVVKVWYQAQEKEGEFNGNYAFNYITYYSRIGKFLTIYPLAPKYTYNSPYTFFVDCVIDVGGAMF